MSDFNFASDGFKSFADRIPGEREERKQIKGKILSFGVRFLDLALGGIFPNDLILVGAKTGVGKTALASRIAFVNAGKGKRVHYFALEAEDREIERRTKFALIHGLMYTSKDPNAQHLNFLDWYTGAQDDLTDAYEARADQMLVDKFKTFHTFYKSADFYAEQFEKMVLAVQDETDLVILDHLHYVDSKDENDNRAYKQIVKKVRDTALSMGKPVVVIAHLRKSNSTALVPESVEEFHGSSDVPKIATKVIVLAPDYTTPQPNNYEWPTYIAPLKCRPDSTRTRFVARCDYDIRSLSYSERFTLGKIKSRGEEFEITDKWPVWAVERDIKPRQRELGR